MSAKRTLILAAATLALVVAPVATWAGELDGVIRTVQQLESRPVMDVVQARQIKGDERTTAYFYEDRIEYYDEALLRDIAELVNLPDRAEDGVPFTDLFLTQFRKHPGLYVVQRGWDADGNCQTSTYRLRVQLSSPAESAGSFDVLGLGEENRCSGDP